MKFEILRETLLRPLLLVTGVVERRQTLPILSNVLVQVDGSRVTLTGTDLEVQLVARVDLAEPAAMDGDVTVPARKLADIWRSLPEGVRVSIELQADRLVVRAGRSRFSLSTLAAGEFPSLDQGQADIDFKLSREEARRLIDSTSFAMAQQDVRYFLNGLLVEVSPEHIRTVATDGHRLAMCTRPHAEGNDAPSSLRQAIVPRKGVQELARLLTDDCENAELRLGDAHLAVDAGDCTLTTKLIDGKFPDYDRVIPKGGDQNMVADRETLQSAFGRAAILSNEKYRGVRLTVENQTLTVQANNPDQEEAEESVEVEFDGQGIEIGFNVVYLQDVLGVLGGDDVRMTFLDANSSAVVEEVDRADSVYVVMPMRL